MPSYTQYKRQVAFDDDNDIESWITVRGNHIPIKKGQSKEEAVKSFIEHQAGKNDTPQGVKWTPTNKKGEGTGNVKKEEKPKYNIQHGAKLQDIESMINKHADKKAYKSWKEEEEYVAEKLKEEGIYAYGGQIKEAMKNVYGDVYTQERKEESKPKSSSKTTFYKNVSGKELWSPAWKGSGRKSGYTAVENQLLTEKEMEKHGFNKESSAFQKMELGKKDHHYMFGARFETKKNENKPESKYDPEFEVVRKNALANSSLYGGKYTQKSKAEAYKEYKNDTASKENIKKANAFVNGEGSGKNKIKAQTTEPEGIIAEKRLESHRIHEREKKIDNAIMEKNKKDWEKTQRQDRAAWANRTEEEKERDRINGAEYERPTDGYVIPEDYKKYHEKDSKEKHENAAYFYGEKMAGVQRKANNENDPNQKIYRQHFEEYQALAHWHEEQAKKAASPKVTRVDAKKWNSPASDPWKSLYDSADTKHKWSGKWKK